jgi:hypothetical protein
MHSQKSTTEVKNTGGKERIIESLSIAHIATDEDGTLKIKKLEDFRDSKVYLEQKQLMGAAHANK